MAFFETPRFPDDISLNSQVTTAYKTDIVERTAGQESRLARWQEAKRSYNAAFGVRNQAQVLALVEFFNACLGMLHGFRFQDPTDHKSCAALNTPSPTDQILVAADGSTTQYPLRKRYTSGQSVYRPITKPVSGTVRVAINGTEQFSGFTVDTTSGIVTFSSAPGGTVTAGFEFDVPCRFDTDALNINLLTNRYSSFNIPIVEIRV